MGEPKVKSNRYVKKSDVVTAEQLTGLRISKEFAKGVATVKQGIVDAKPGDWLISHPPIKATVHNSDDPAPNKVEDVAQYEVLTDAEFQATYESADE